MEKIWNNMEQPWLQPLGFQQRAGFRKKKIRHLREKWW